MTIGPARSGVTEQERLRKLGRHIKRLRQDADLSQEALADAAGLNRNTISAVERGTTAASVTVLFKIADALKVAPGTLFEPF